MNRESSQTVSEFRTVATKMLADLVTPVAIYLKVRDVYPYSLLLEGADSRGAENSFSFICVDPLAHFEVRDGVVECQGANSSINQRRVSSQADLLAAFDLFKGSFKVEKTTEHPDVSGFYGFSSYDSIELFEEITLKNTHHLSSSLPQLSYRFYRYIIAINHFKSELYLIEHREVTADDADADFSHKKLLERISHQDVPQYPFALESAEESSMTDDEHRKMIADCKKHIFRGDIFQIVPSRRFSYSYSGDDFNVYRALRSINPSPYLFYFDFGDFRLFGSSPEAQLIIKDKKATIFPIAGTYRRTGNEQSDFELAQKLASDPKENAEHVMLVDLARNDLSRHCTDVTVESYKEAHFYSHVIHLVSKVTGTLADDFNTLAVLGDTFPAGTLSGAPKYKAMQLIDTYERGRRGFYGGCLGFIGLNGDCNHCIIIRSFFSSNNQLVLRAGGGVVADSVEESEVQEVRNKLNALRVALESAQRGIHE